MTTRLLILGGDRLPSGSSGQYRGVYRERPGYQENLGPDHEVNRVFSLFCEKGGQELVLSDISFTRQVVEVYRRLNPPQLFDIVELTSPNQEPQFSSNLLGYDVSSGTGFSMLSWGLALTANASEDFRDEPLLALIEKYFKPQLNGSGLFDSPEVARSCLDCLASLNELIPSLFWSRQSIFDVFAIHLVA